MCLQISGPKWSYYDVISNALGDVRPLLIYKPHVLRNQRSLLGSGDDLGRIFSVKIAATKTADSLKQAINGHAFRHVGVSKRTLWKVLGINFDDDNLKGNLDKLNVDDGLEGRLMLWLKLSSGFEDRLLRVP